MSEVLKKTLELKKELRELAKTDPEKALAILQQENWKRRHRPMGIHGTNAAKARRYKKDYCERCGSKENLLAHHKNKDQSDNRPENIETLCKTCHNQHHLRREQLYE